MIEKIKERKEEETASTKLVRRSMKAFFPLNTTCKRVNWSESGESREGKNGRACDFSNSQIDFVIICADQSISGSGRRAERKE